MDLKLEQLTLEAADVMTMLHTRLTVKLFHLNLSNRITIIPYD
jgi:hypothetical protein